MGSFKAVFRARRIKDASGAMSNADDGYIHILYTHKGKPTYFSTKVQVDSKTHWNDTKQKVDSTKGIRKSRNKIALVDSLMKRDKSSTDVIKKYKADIERIARDFERQDIEPTGKRVKAEYKSSKQQKGINQNFEELFNDFLDAPSIQGKQRTESTRKQYGSCLFNLKRYAKDKGLSLTLELISKDFYGKYLGYLEKEQGMKLNSRGNQIKNLKAFCRWLSKNKGYDFGFDLASLKATKELMEIIFLSEEELRLLEHLDLDNKPGLDKVRDLFLFQCYTGLRYSDLTRFNKDHINGVIIEMKALKTGKKIYIPLRPEAHKLLVKYSLELPRLSEHWCNEQLKRLGRLAGINETIEQQKMVSGKKIHTHVPKWQLLTTHIACKTFISLGVADGIQIGTMSKMTGRSKKILLDHYYEVSETDIVKEMERAYGSVNPDMKVV